MAYQIGIIGAGAWGTALAELLCRKGHTVTLWAHEREVVTAIGQTRENALFLPGFPLPPDLHVTNDLPRAVTGAEYVVLVSPSHVLRDVARHIAPHLAPKAIVVNCSKGIDMDTGQLISDLLAAALPAHPPTQFAFLSGPSFAREVAQHLLTAVVVASRSPQVANAVQTLFRTPYFLTFCHDDIIGVQVGGAVKNVMAIATGISDGLELGLNTRAALLTRGLYEMMKLGRALGANPLTFVGLAGVGDLILTCTGDLSRNRTLGMALARGQTLAEITSASHTVAEGVASTKAVYHLIERHQITAPICTAVYQVLYEGKPAARAVAELTTMELGAELGGLMHAPGS